MLDICSKCKQKRFIVNKTHNLCQECNYFRLHGETEIEAKIRKKKGKPIQSYQKTKKVSNFRYCISEKRKEQLMKDRETYKKVFKNGNCRCENCNQPLPTEFEDEKGNIIAIWRYSHILSKSSYPEYRNKEWNFNDLCLKCHQQWEFGDRKSMYIYEKNKQIIINNTGLDILK